MPKYYRDPQTDEIIEYDDNGRKVRVVSTGDETRKLFPQRSYRGTPKQTAKPRGQNPRINLGGEVQTEETELIKAGRGAVSGARMFGEALPVGLSLLGEALGPVGGIAGSLAGSAIQAELQKNQPYLFGEPPENPTLSMLGDAALNIAGTPIMKGISNLATPGGKRLSYSLAGIFTKGREVDPDVAAGLAARPNLEPTTGQLVGGVPQVVENIFAPFSKRKRVASQQQELTREFLGEIPLPTETQESIGAGIKAELIRGDERSKAITNVLYERLGEVADKNVIRLSSNGDVIRGPVYLTDSAKLAKRLLDQIKEQYKAKNTQALFNMFAEEERRYLTDLENLASLVDAKGKVKPVGIDAARKTKTLLGSGIFDRYLPEGASEANTRQLYHLIDQDVKDSIIGNPLKGTLGWKVDSTAGFKNYILANKSHETRMKIFKDNPAVSNALESPLSGIDSVKEILKDPISIERAIQGSADSSRTRELLKTEFMQDLFEKAHKPNVKELDPNKALDIFTSRVEGAAVRRLFSSSERASLTQFFKVIRTMDPKLPTYGLSALSLRAGYAGLTLAAGMVPLLLSEDAPSGMRNASLTLGGIFSANMMARILMNPRTARIATRLAKANPKSQTAKQLSRSLFLALKGGQVYLTAPNGAILGVGEINEKGRVEPLQFDQE